MDKQLFTVPFIPHVLSYSFSGLLIFQSVMPAISARLEPVTSETMIDSAGNGVPIINIAPPDRAGISHNQYRHFNVGKEGVILNNATNYLTLTQLGGLIQNNPNLTPGYEASEIINEVIGANRSELQGFIEVAGKPAHTVVANAYGITCDGCGFINIPQATLTTGKPILDAEGILQALQVNRGRIIIDGQGLNATQTDKVSLIARATEINAQLHAKDLKIITGKNLVHVNGSIISIKGDGRVPALAIDTRELGGMYANRINLISNENGVGVNVGNLNAREEDISLNSMGEITLRNTLSEGSLTVNGMQVSLTGAHKTGKQLSISAHQDLTLNQATLSSGREISLMSKGSLNVNDSHIAAGVDTSSMVIPQGKLRLKAKYQSLNNSELTTDYLSFNAKQNFVQDSSSRVIGRERVNINAKQININGSVSSGKKLAISGQEMNTGSQSELNALHNLNINVTNDVILKGKLLAAQDLVISGSPLVRMGKPAANRHHTVLTQKLNNQGQLQARGCMYIQNGMLTNDGHILSDLNLSISTHNLQNSGSIHSSRATVIQSEHINADEGSILYSNGDIRLAGNTITLAGHTSTEKNFFVDSQVLKTRAPAKLQSFENMAINVTKQAEIAGDILSCEHLLMEADSLIHLGKIRAKTIKIKSSTLANRGQVTSFSDLTFKGSSLNQAGTMKALGSTSVFADTVNNYGLFESDTFIFKAGHHFDNTTSGIIHAESEINLRAASVENTGKLIAKKLTANTDAIDNNGLIRGAEILNLGTKTLNNGQKGVLYSRHPFTLSTSQLINAGLVESASGVVFKGNTLANSGEIHAASLILENQNINNSGRLLADKSLALTSNALINTGLLSADIVAITTPMITNTGTVQGKNGLSINAGSLSHGTEGRIKSGSDLILTSTALEALGHIVALGDVTLSTVSPFISKNILAAGKKLIIRGQGDVVNRDIMQGKSIHLDAGGTFRNQGKIQLGTESSTFNAQRIKLEKNSTLQAGSDITLTSRYDISVNGFAGTQGSLTLHADSNITNTALLYADHDIHLYSHRIKNQQGDILAGNNMWLQKDPTGKANTEITNISGSIETQRGNIVLATQHFTNERQTLNLTRSEPVNLRQKYSWLSETAALIPITELELGVDYGYITGNASGGGGSSGHGAANSFFYAATSPLNTSPPKEFALSQCQQSVTAEGGAGRISAAQNISINASVLNNVSSSILAGKDLSITANTLKNQSYTAGTLTRYQTYAASVPISSERVKLTLPNKNRYRFFNRDIRYVATGAIREELVNSKIYRATIQAMDDIALQVVHQIGNTSVQANTGQSTTAMIATPSLNTLSPLPVDTEVALEEIDNSDWNSLLQEVLQSIGEGMSELDNAVPLHANTHDYPHPTESDSFFTPTPDPLSRYLIMANPKLSGLGQLDNSLFDDLNTFLSVQPTRPPRETQRLWTDETQFYGSAYFMDRLKLSPDYDYRFLGDAAFDTRYISNAVLNHTGSRYLRGMGSDLAQMRSLIDNAARQQEALNLVFGVGLNARQIAALDGSIVWWESRTIRGKKVMIPKLYLSAKDTVVRNGSVIAGKNVRVTGGQIANEGSSLIARYDLDVYSQNSVDSMNLGLLNAGGNLKVDALGNINNLGSVIDGKTVQLASMGGSINVVTPAYDWNARGTGFDGQTIDFIHTQTGPQARIDAQDELTLMAGNSLTFKDSRVLTGGDLQMKAGGDIMIEGNTLTHQHQQSRTWRQPSSSRHRVSYQETTVNAGGKVQAQAGNNITVIGSSIDAGDNSTLLAGLTINLNAVETRDNHHTGGRAAHRTELARTSLTTGGNLLLRAGQDIHGQAAGLASEQNVTLQALRDMNLLAKETRGGDSHHTSENITINERVRQQGFEIVSEDNTLIHAGRDFKAQSADLVTQGYLGISGGRDINLTTARESDYSYHENSRTSGGLLSKTTTHTIEEKGATRSKGAVLCGDIVTVQAGNNILLQGATVLSERDVKLGATRNINILAATNSDTSWQFSETHRRGLMGTGGIGFTLGSKKNTHSRREQGTTQSESFSTVGSTGGNALITAGQQVHMGGGDIIALQGITIRGDSVVVMPGHNKRTYDERYESKSSGLTVALSGIVGSAVNNAIQAKKEIKGESDSRLRALKMTKAALAGIQSAQSLAVARISGDLNKALGVSLSLSTQKAKSTQHVESNTVAGSTINAGGHLAMTATGEGQSKNKGDIVIGGSQLKAGGDAIFLANNDIVLSGAANTQKMTGENNGSGGGVGVGLTGGTHGYGLSVFASTNASKGHNKGNSTTWTETTLDSGSMASITSGRDAVLEGALISSNKVVANIGQSLWMSSQQYSNDYHAKQNSIAAGGGFTFGSITGSGNFSVSEDKIKSTYHSVLQQTGIYTGKGGFDIQVGQRTQLDGAVIASLADKSHNRLDTSTLGFKDIHNQADFSVSHSGISLSGGGQFGDDMFKGHLSGGMISTGGNRGHVKGTTQAAVAAGTILVRQPTCQNQNIAQLSRDTEHANDSISPIFNKDKEQARLQKIRIISELGGQIGNIAYAQGEINALALAREQFPNKSIEELKRTSAYRDEQVKYGIGSGIQRGIQTATAALQGLAGGNLTAALAGASAPQLANVIGHHAGIEDNPVAKSLAHAILGGVVATLQGNNVVAGTAGGASAELAAQAIISRLYPDKSVHELSESEKQTLSVLSSMAAGMVGGLAGDSTLAAVTGAQSGKNTVENNHLSLPNGIMNHAQAESSLGLFMAQNGASADEISRAQADLAKGLGTGAPQPATELVKKWALLMSSAATLGTGAAAGIGGAVTGGVIGGVANSSTQLTVNGDKPFSYTDALVAIGTGALSQDKGAVITGGISVGGAYVGSTIKGEDPANAMIGAGVGSIIGSGTSTVVTDKLKPLVTDKAADILGNIAGSASSEAAGNAVQHIIDKEASK